MLILQGELRKIDTFHKMFAKWAYWEENIWTKQNIFFLFWINIVETDTCCFFLNDYNFWKLEIKKNQHITNVDYSLKWVEDEYNDATSYKGNSNVDIVDIDDIDNILRRIIRHLLLIIVSNYQGNFNCRYRRYQHHFKIHTT